MRKNYLFHLGILIYLLFMYFGRDTFSFMSLNVFLAWLPIVFGQLFLKVKTGARWIFAPLWLLFFPNVPYLMTDLFHLASLTIYQPNGQFLPVSNDWWSYFLLVVPIFIMVFIGMAQVFKLFSAVRVQGLKRVGGFGVLAVLSGIAVYIGRFERIHSIELLLRPVMVLKSLVGHWQSEKIQFVLMFSLLQLAIWGLIYFLQRAVKEE